MSQCDGKVNVHQAPPGPDGALHIQCLNPKIPCSECKVPVDLNGNNGCHDCYKPLCKEHMLTCHCCKDCHIKHTCCGECQTTQTKRHWCRLCGKLCHKTTRRYLPDHPLCESTQFAVNLCCRCVPLGFPTAHTKPHETCKCGIELCSDIKRQECFTCNKPLHKLVQAYTYKSGECKATQEWTVLQCCYCGMLPPTYTLIRDKHMLCYEDCEDCKGSICTDGQWSVDAFCYRCKVIKPHVINIKCSVNECKCDACLFDSMQHNLCCTCYIENPNDIITEEFCRRTGTGKKRFKQCGECGTTICARATAVITKRGVHICSMCACRYPHIKVCGVRIIKGYVCYVWGPGRFNNTNNAFL